MSDFDIELTDSLLKISNDIKDLTWIFDNNWHRLNNKT